MSNDERRRRERVEDDDPEKAQDDLVGSLEQLDRAAARVRQLIYRIRPLLRDQNDGHKEGEDRDDRKPARGRFRRRDG